MRTARTQHTATLLPNGAVLVASGQTGTNHTPIASAELYIPATETWTATSDLNTGRFTHKAILLPNDNVLVAGGWNGLNGNLSSAELYVPGPRLDLIRAVKPSFSELSLSTNYQLQVSADLNTWTNQGSAFTATNTSMVYPQYWDVDNWNQLFFRLQVLP